MRVVIPNPNQEYPKNVIPAKFTPEEGLDNVEPTYGLVHKDPEGKTVALEFMLELTEEDLMVLKHEPYLTLTIASEILPPFAIQTSFPYNEKYKKMAEHHHICRSNLMHVENIFWRCDNPMHDKSHKFRECDNCWQMRTSEMDAQDGVEREERVDSSEQA